MKKSLYRLKHAPRQWNKRINDFFVTYGLTQSQAGAGLYYMINDDVRLYVILYVNDGIICNDNIVQMHYLLCKLSLEFSVKSSKAQFLVGMQIKRDRNLKTLKLFRSAYTHKILNRFDLILINFDNCASFSCNTMHSASHCFKASRRHARLLAPRRDRWRQRRP